MKPTLIAHRGDTIHFRENTIDAFRSALDAGADGFECDVQLHRGKLIIVHNYLFDKKASYPLLSEVLGSFANQGIIEIDMKEMNMHFLSSFVNLLSKYPSAKFEITSNFFPIIPSLRKALPTIKLGILFNNTDFASWMTPSFIRRKVLETMKLLHGNVAHLPFNVIDRKLVSACRDNDITVHTHLIKQDMDKQIKQYQEITKLGVAQCTFDDINLLKAISRND